jgi:hypothetical protein
LLPGNSFFSQPLSEDAGRGFFLWSKKGAAVNRHLEAYDIINEYAKVKKFWQRGNLETRAKKGRRNFRMSEKIGLIITIFLVT